MAEQKKFYGLRNDYMFHAVLQESQTVLVSLVSALMDIPKDRIASCLLENPIIYGKALDQKDSVLDLLLVLNDSKRINIELQVSFQKDWTDRSLLYWCRTFDRLPKGETYGELLPAYHIGILDFTLFPEEPEFYSEYRVKNVRTGSIYSDKFCIRVLDLTQMKLADSSAKGQELLRWAKAFTATSIEELEELSREDEVFLEMQYTMKVLTEDERVRMQCEARQMYEWSMAAQYRGGFEDGKAEGEQQLSRLLSALIEADRVEDARRVLTDGEYRKQLYLEFGIAEG